MVGREANQRTESAAFIPALVGGALGIFLFGGSAQVHRHPITSWPGLLYAAAILTCIAGPIVISSVWYSVVKSWSNSGEIVVMILGFLWVSGVLSVAFGTSFLSIDD